MRADGTSPRNEDARRMHERERADERMKRPADREERLLNEAEEAVSAMEMREQRRSGSYRTGGDDHNIGVDTDTDSNAPKDSATTGTRGGGSRGKSDGR
jgi:hypothetical protein